MPRGSSPSTTRNSASGYTARIRPATRQSPVAFSRPVPWDSSGSSWPSDVGRHGLHKCPRLPHRVLGVALTDTGPAVIGAVAEPQEIRQRPAQAASIVFPPLDELFNTL